MKRGGKKLYSAKVRAIDLHGKTTRETEEIVSAEVSRAIMQGESRLEFVHGLGTGKVKQTVHATLSQLGVAKRFEVSTKNPGVTVVYL